MAPPNKLPRETLVKLGLEWTRKHKMYPRYIDMKWPDLPPDTTIRRRFGNIPSYHRAIYQADPSLPLPPVRKGRKGSDNPWGPQQERHITERQTTRGARDDELALVDLDSPMGPPVKVPRARATVGEPQYGEYPPMVFTGVQSWIRRYK